MRLPSTELPHAALVAALFAAQAGAAQLPLYDARLLPLPPGVSSASALSVNSQGVVVGEFFNAATGWFDGLVWDENGTPGAMSTLFGLTEAGGYRVNDDGTIVGSASLTGAEVSRGLVVAPNGAVTLLPSLAGDQGVISAAFDRNVHGIVAGRSSTVPTPFWLSAPADAVLWQNAQVTSIGTLGGFFAEARRINAQGVVIGRSNTASSDFARGFVWDPLTGMREIAPAEPGGIGHVEALDDTGRIVGRVTLGGTWRGALWAHPDAAPTLLPLLPGDTGSSALAIHGSGLIGGSAEDGLGQTRARLWLDGAAHELAPRLAVPAPFALEAVIDIAPNGTLLVRGPNPQGPGWGQAVLTPVPPAALVGLPATVGLGSGGSQYLTLDAGPVHGGAIHLLLGSAGGTAPGIPLGEVTLPLVLDDYLLFSLEFANRPPFLGTLGQLDAEGRASAELSIPAGLNPGMAGLALHHAFVLFDPLTGAFPFASNPVPLQFQAH